MWAIAGKYSAIGLEMAACVLLGHFGGQYLDERFRTKPYLSYSGLGVGIAAAFYTLYRLVKTTNLDKQP